MSGHIALALTLFPDDDYEEFATRVTGSLDRFGCWNAAWTVPTDSAITQTRKRLGRNMFAELFQRAGGPVAGPVGTQAHPMALGAAQGSFLRGWRLVSIDGFEVVRYVITYAGSLPSDRRSRTSHAAIASSTAALADGVDQYCC